MEELLEDAHRQGDAAQDLLYLTLQALQHLVWAQVGSSLDRGKDRHPKTSTTSLQAGSWHSGYWKGTSPPEAPLLSRLPGIRDHQTWETRGVSLGPMGRLPA